MGSAEKGKQFIELSLAKREPPPYEWPPDVTIEKPKQSVGWPEPLNFDDLATREPERPRFIMDPWLPCGYVTGIWGHGGVGKSGIALHLAVCVASGQPFFGLQVQERRVLYLSCEDRENILHWRLTRICAHLDISMESLAGRLYVLDLVGHEVVLWERDPRTGGTFTPALSELEERIKRLGIELLLVDGISDTYGGNENARTEIKRYVNRLCSLIPPETGAVLLVGHIAKPTASNAETTEGYSGSTGWHNNVRARWYLYPETVRPEEGGRAERTGDLILELQKSNFGPIDKQMRFSWNNEKHLFVGRQTEEPSWLERNIRERNEQDGIVAAFKACAATTPPTDVPAASQGQRTAYHVLQARSEFPSSLRGGKPEKRRFWRLIEQLRAIGSIRESSIRRSNRHILATLKLTDTATAPNASNTD